MKVIKGIKDIQIFDPDYFKFGYPIFVKNSLGGYYGLIAGVEQKNIYILTTPYYELKERNFELQKDCNIVNIEFDRVASGEFELEMMEFKEVV